MVAGYTRQAAANIQSGLRCNAEDVNAEYNQLANAFDNTNGHDHSGSVAGDAARIPLGSAVSGVLPVANGGTGTSSGSGGPFLSLTGGVVSGGITVQGPGTALDVVNNALVSGILTVGGVGGSTTVTAGAVTSTGALSAGTVSATSVTASAAAGTTAFSATAGNAVIGGGVTVTGQLSGNVGLRATYAVEADFSGTAFYAPSGNFVGLGATLAAAGATTALSIPNAGGSAVINCPSGAISATAFNVVSDAALKMEVTDHAFGLAHILALAPKSYRRVAAPEREEAGLIAQDVAAVLPHAVVEIPGVAALLEDPWAAPGEAGPAVLALDYAAVVVALINAVKGLAAQVEALSAKVGG